MHGEDGVHAKAKEEGGDNVRDLPNRRHRIVKPEAHGLAGVLWHFSRLAVQRSRIEVEEDVESAGKKCRPANDVFPHARSRIFEEDQRDAHDQKRKDDFEPQSAAAVNAIPKGRRRNGIRKNPVQSVHFQFVTLSSDSGSSSGGYFPRWFTPARSGSLCGLNKYAIVVSFLPMGCGLSRGFMWPSCMAEEMVGRSRKPRWTPFRAIPMKTSVPTTILHQS